MTGPCETNGSAYPVCSCKDRWDKQNHLACSPGTVLSEHWFNWQMRGHSLQGLMYSWFYHACVRPAHTLLQCCVLLEHDAPTRLCLSMFACVFFMYMLFCVLKYSQVSLWAKMQLRLTDSQLGDTDNYLNLYVCVCVCMCVCAWTQIFFNILLTVDVLLSS